MKPQNLRLFIEQIHQQLPKTKCYTDPADCTAYGYDNSRRQSLPDVVLFPTSEEEIITVIRLCNHFSIPALARGRGTGTTGAAVPIYHGLVISLEHMNRIIEVDAANRVMVVEPGVLNSEVQEAAARFGFFWPPDPSSSATCSIGGNLACNAAGPRAIKYGSCRENTLGLRAITGSGECIKTGTYTTKGVVGYDLTRLIIGSEGTLALITQATLKLIPLPETKRTLQLIYSDIHHAAAAVSRIMSQPIIPCALEFMDKACINIIHHRNGIEFPINSGALLIVEIDGSTSTILNDLEKVSAAAEGEGLLEKRLAKTEAEVKNMWQTRKALSPGLRHIAPKKINEDIVVPVSSIPTLIHALEQLSKKYQIIIVNFGHAGNGNLHVNLLIDPDDANQQQHAEQCLEEIFNLVVNLKGCLSGEHGIGIEKRRFISKELDPNALTLMHQIKRVFDPALIMNPGKYLPDPTL